MKPRSTSTIIEKTEKAELVRVEHKGKTFYRVFFNIRPNDGTGLPGFSTMADCKEGFGDDEGAARAFFEEKKNGEQAAEEAKAEEKKEAGMAKLSEKQIEALEKKGFRRWTKGDYDRLYINVIKLPGVYGSSSELEIDGDKLSRTKSWKVSNAKIWIDVATAEVHAEAAYHEDFLKSAAKKLLSEVIETEAEADETPAKEKDILTMSAERAEEKAAFSTIALAESILRPFAEDANAQKNLEMLRNVKTLIAGHAPNAKKLMAKLKDMDAFIGQARKIADTAAAKIAAAM
jgi:hypothetical protein